jgi:adenine-specific DNA methylase
MKKWRDLFTPRQLLALGSFVKHTRKAIEEISCRTPAYTIATAEICETNRKQAELIGAYLGILLGKFVDYFSSLCLWSGTNDEVLHTFSRYALPINWDFPEANPFTESARFYVGGVEVASKVIEHLLAVPRAQFGPAIMRKSSLSGDHNIVYDFIVTDPPYYDAIPYSDLMDYFYIWLRRIFNGLIIENETAFYDMLSPKWKEVEQDGELIDDETRFNGDRTKSKLAYENGMAKTFKIACGNLMDNGRLVIVFANKSVDAWETLVGALIKSGAVVSASWPIQTERSGRLRSNSSAALASSVWIV